MASSSSGGRNPELRKDAVSNRWVIFSPARAKRPSDFKSKSPADSNHNQQQQCPFCIGHEHECAPEIFRVPSDNPDWIIRVIQNLYPALSRHLQDPLAQNSSSGPGDANWVLDGFEFHDVVIEIPLFGLLPSTLRRRLENRPPSSLLPSTLHRRPGIVTLLLHFNFSFLVFSLVDKRTHQSFP